MSAVLRPPPLREGRGGGITVRAEEPSAKYLSQLEPTVVRNFDLLATSLGGVASLRELILTLAVQGKLVPQDPRDEPASAALRKIRLEKDGLIAEGKIKRDKSTEASPAEEDKFELPPGWCRTRVENICTLVTDGEHATPQRCDDPTAVPLVTAKNVRHEVMDYSVTDFVPFDTAQKCWQRCKPAAGDILMVSVGATLGRLCVLRDAVDMVLVRSVTVLRPAQSGVMPDFLACHLMSPGTQREIWREVKQSAQPCLYLSKSAALNIALPPLAEQSRIVARVEELMRLCDALQAKGKLEAAQHAQLLSTLLGTLTDSETPEALAENWHRVAAHFDLLLDRPEAIDALEQTILQLAVRGLLVPQDPADKPASVPLQKIRAEKDRLIAEGKIKRDKPLPPMDQGPSGLLQGWVWVRLGEVVEMLNGYAFKSEWFKSSGVRLLRNVNVGHGKVNWAQPVFIDKASASEFEQFKLDEGDIVLTLDRPIISTGLKFAVLTGADVPCLLLQRVARLTPRSNVMSAEFLILWLQSDAFLGSIDPGRSNGVPHISTKQVGELIAGLPPLAEQSRIVARVESLRRLCADLRERLSVSQAAHARLAESLVASATA